MKRFMALMISLSLVFSVAMISGCEKKESDAGKDIKRTLDRAQDAVDKVNKRQKDSIPGQ